MGMCKYRVWQSLEVKRDLKKCLEVKLSIRKEMAVVKNFESACAVVSDCYWQNVYLISRVIKELQDLLDLVETVENQ